MKGSQMPESSAQLQLDWTYGFGGKANYISTETLVYKCSNKVTFANSTGGYFYFVPDFLTIGHVAVHPVNKVFAITDVDPKPKVYIHQFPDLERTHVLDLHQEGDVMKIVFSHSVYLAVIIGVPEYKLNLWNYNTEQVLCSVDLLHEEILCFTFNPTNWREMCIAYAKDLQVWRTSQSNDAYHIRKIDLALPYADVSSPSQMVVRSPAISPREKAPSRGKSRDGTRASLRNTRVHFDIPQRAIAGVDGAEAQEFFRYKDKKEHVKPLCHAWLPTGEIVVGCAGGQLLKVDTEQTQVTVLQTPGLIKAATLVDTLESRPTSAKPAPAQSPAVPPTEASNLSKLSPIPTKGVKPVNPRNSQGQDDQPLTTEDITTDQEALANDTLGYGSADVMVLHKNGLFIGGKEGIVRRVVIKGNSVTVTYRLNVGAPVVNLSFNQLFSQLASSLDNGSLHIFEPGTHSDHTWMVFENMCGKLVAVQQVCPGSDQCISARENGMLQIWNMDQGFMSRVWSIGERIYSLVTGMLAPVAAIGTESGHVYICDISNTENLRIIHRAHLHKGPVKCLHVTKDGRYLLTASDDGHIFFMEFQAMSRYPIIGHLNLKGEVDAIDSFAHERTGSIKVVVTSRTMESNFLGANKLMHFTLPTDLLHDLPQKYANLHKEFKEDLLGVLRFNLGNPSFGVCLADSSTVIVVGQNNKALHRITLPSEPPKKENSKDSFLYPSSEMPGHLLSGGKLATSSNGKWLASVSKDGRLLLRALSTPDKVTEHFCHDYVSGGARCLTLTSDGQRIVTGGMDGSICCYKLLALEVKGKSSRQVLKEFYGNMNDQIEKDKFAVKNMREWQRPTEDSKPRQNSAEKKAKEEEETVKMIEAAIEKDELYVTPPLVADEDATWLENAVFEAHQKEDTDFSAAKSELRNHIRDMRLKLQEMLKLNSQVPDIEKLGHHEFDLDVEEQARLEAAGDSEVARIKEEKELENLAKLYVADIIRKECWDNMEVKGRTLCSLRSHWEVTNYPLQARTKKELRELEIIQERRKLELYELEKRKEVVEANSGKPSHADELMELEMDPETRSKLELLQFAISGSLGSAFGGESELFYTQFELYTREQKQAQVIMLKDAIYRMKQHFNKTFSELFTKKESEIGKIKEKNKRIKKILSDLNHKPNVWEPELNIKEQPEQLLTVKDEEITVEKFLTPEEQALQEQREREEAERLAREKKDNWRERGLDQMMGGVLEIRKEDELKKDVPKPAFMGTKLEADYTDEEKKQVLDYERKCKELNEEREKFRKQLEQELKKLQLSTDEAVDAFDLNMKGLFYKKIKTEMAIFQEELKMVRIKSSLLLEEEVTAYERSLHKVLHQKRQAKVQGQQQIIDLKKKIEQFKDQYELFVAEDKVMDKEFKRRFTDTPLFQQDTLYKLFKRRPRGQKARLVDLPGYDQQFGNPYWDRPSSSHRDVAAQKALEAGLAELDSVEKNMPEGLDIEIWNRFCAYRKQKIESENALKLKAQTLAEMEAFIKHRIQEDQRASLEIEQLMDEFSRLREDKMRHLLNLEVQLLLKQGQVEVDPGIFLPDYSNCALIHRATVEDLNAKINELGKSKIHSMMESKDFRKGIVQREWEKLKNTMEMDDLRERMKDIQMMKVTREIQKFLVTPDYDAQIQKSAQTLEQTLNLLKEHHQKKIHERQSNIKEVDRSVRRKVRENEGLASELQDLNLKTHERKHVCPDDHMLSAQAQRYQEIIQRRRLVELAKAQAQEVAVLRAEVERLRMRTFPALVQVDH